jgi:hypothetical protein
MTTIVAQPRRLTLRHRWIVPGLALAVYANALAADHGLGLGDGLRTADGWRRPRMSP